MVQLIQLRRFLLLLFAAVDTLIASSAFLIYATTAVAWEVVQPDYSQNISHLVFTTGRVAAVAQVLSGAGVAVVEPTTAAGREDSYCLDFCLGRRPQATLVSFDRSPQRSGPSSKATSPTSR